MTNTNKAIWALRIGVAGEFLGHGVFALQGKPDWIGWFAKFGVSDPSTAATLLTLVGLMDILVALVVLFRPIKANIAMGCILGLLDRAGASDCRPADMGFRRTLRQLGRAARASLLV